MISSTTVVDEDDLDDHEDSDFGGF